MEHHKVSVIVPCKDERVEVIYAPDLGKITAPGLKRDVAAVMSTGDILAFTDDDCYPDPDWVSSALKVFDEDPNVAIVCGPNLTAPGDAYWQQCSGWVYWILGGWRYRRTKRKEVDDAPSCNLFIRSKVFWEVGGFGTDIWPGEDTVLCEKVLRAGHSMVYDPTVCVYHHRRGFIEHLKQVARYGQMRGAVMKATPRTSRKLKYFLPAGVVVLLVATVIVYGFMFIKGLLK